MAKNNCWNNGDRHKIHEIFLTNCFVFVITLVWKTVHSSALAQIEAHLMEKNIATNSSHVTVLILAGWTKNPLATTLSLTFFPSDHQDLLVKPSTKTGQRMGVPHTCLVSYEIKDWQVLSAKVVIFNICATFVRLNLAVLWYNDLFRSANQSSLSLTKFHISEPLFHPVIHPESNSGSQLKISWKIVQSEVFEHSALPWLISKWHSDSQFVIDLFP